MRLFVLILFVGLVLTDDQITKAIDKKADDVKGIKKPIEQPKSKTEKRDYSDQTGSYGLNTNEEPFKPMLTSNTEAYDVAASATQQVFYDKSHLTAEEAANVKETINHQTANAYQAPYSRVINQHQPQQQQQYYQQQQQQQQQQYKHNFINAGKNAGAQENQQSIIYAEPHNAASYNYERIPQQQHQQPAQRGQQKQIQYVLAIPITYLRQLQQQILNQQQQEHSPHLQAHKVQQQPAQQQPIYSIAGPLARDNQGAYRPFHRFSPAAVNDVPSNPSGQHRSAASPLLPASAAPPGYITQYIQIPASVLLAAAQSAQIQQRPFNIQHQAAYQQQPSAQPHQQNTQTQSPQLYYYQPQQQQQQQHYQQQPQLKQSQSSHVLSPPPLYDYNGQQQSGTQQHQAVQHIPDYQQQLQYQQQPNAGRQQQHPIESVRSNGSVRLSQHGGQSSAQTYEYEQAQLASIHAQSLVKAHNQQPVPVSQAPTPGHKLVPAIATATVPAPAVGYERIVHFNPQYLQQYIHQPLQQQQLQQQRIKYQQPQHRLQVQQAHQHQALAQQQQVPLVDNLSNSPYAQGIHGPTPLPFVSVQHNAAVRAHNHLAPLPSQLTPYYNYNLISSGMHQPFLSNALQPSYAPLGVPSKVTSFTNVLLQPFQGHHSSSYQIPEMGGAAAASTDSLPFFNHHTGGIHYGTHLFHPPTPPTPIISNQQHNTVAAVAPAAHQAPTRVAAAVAQQPKTSPKTAKSSTTAGSQTVVKYP